MSCDDCHRDCFIYQECTRDERLPFRNFDKYFGTPERAAQSMANINGLNASFSEWANNDGALYCTLVPNRGSNKTRKQAEVFEIWLQKECE